MKDFIDEGLGGSEKRSREREAVCVGGRGEMEGSSFKELKLSRVEEAAADSPPPL